MVLLVRQNVVISFLNTNDLKFRDNLVFSITAVNSIKNGFVYKEG